MTRWGHAKDYERGTLGREMYEIQSALTALAELHPREPEVIRSQARFDQVDAHLRYSLAQAIAPYLDEIRHDHDRP